MDEINEYAKLTDSAINEAKKRLAYEVTKIVHGEEEAEIAKKTTEALFENKGGKSDDMKTTEIPSASLAEGVDLAQILVEAGVFKSNGECRRMIDQKGVYLNDVVVADKFYKLTEKDFDKDGEAITRKGKKVYHRLKIV
jgi:tyrosyl-tRNA synthetase